MDQEYRLPEIFNSWLLFGGFSVELSKVVKYTDNTVIIRKEGLYIVWRFTDKYTLTPRWHCDEITTAWLTIV